MMLKKPHLIAPMLISALFLAGCEDDTDSDNSAGSTPHTDNGSTFTPPADHYLSFFDMEGELIEEIGKRNGEIFTVDTPPEPDGYEHIGWDYETFRQSENSFKALETVDVQAVYQLTDEAIRQSNPDNDCIHATPNTTCEVDGETIIKIGENWGISTHDEAHMIRWGWLNSDSYLLYEKAISEENGRANSSIVSQLYSGNADAIDLCTNKGDNWYLPALEELKEIHANKEDFGGVSGDMYWSSTTDPSWSSISVMAFSDNPRHHDDGDITNYFYNQSEANVLCARTF